MTQIHVFYMSKENIEINGNFCDGWPLTENHPSTIHRTLWWVEHSCKTHVSGHHKRTSPFFTWAPARSNSPQRLWHVHSVWHLPHRGIRITVHWIGWLGVYCHCPEDVQLRPAWVDTHMVTTACRDTGQSRQRPASMGKRLFFGFSKKTRLDKTEINHMSQTTNDSDTCVLHEQGQHKIQ